MKTISHFKFNKSNKVLPSRYSLNINPVNFIPKTDRNYRKLSFPVITQPKNSEKNLQKKKPLTNRNIQKSFKKRNSSPNIIFKNKLNQRYLNSSSNNKKDNSLESKNKKIDISKSSKKLKRFSVVLNKNIKIKLNTANIENSSGSKNSHLLTDRSLKQKRRDTNKISSIKILSSRSGKTIEKNPSQESNPFEVEEEDKIFRKFITNKKKKKKKKLKLLFKKDNPLSKVYKKIPYILSEINKVKKLKNDMTLVKYQNTLMEVGSKGLDRDIRNKLNQKFYEIRKSTEKKYDYFEKVIDTIEEKERKIIRKINTQQNFFKKIMVDNNKSNWIYGAGNKIDFFPKIKFYPTPKFLLYNYQNK